MRMSKPEKKALVPALRFPEFRNAETWEQLPIGDKVNLLSGYPFKSEEISENTNGIPLMRGINITEGYIRHSQDMDRFFLGDTQKIKKYFLKINDLVIGMDGSKVGKNSALITEQDSGSLLIQRVARLRTDCNATISFIFQHINSTKFHSYVDRINTSGGIPHISANQINEFEICFPPSDKEQQKIADCLSSIDDLITAQTQKLAALKAHKKGLMQQLFPAEGETVPKLRFPEFRDGGEWEGVLFGSLIKVNSGKGFKASEYSKDGIRLLQIENVGYGLAKWNDNTVYLPEHYALEYADLVLHKGDIVLALNRPVTNDELKIARLKENDDPSLLYQRVGKLELLSEDIIEDFVFQLCQIFVKNFVIKQSIGSDQPFISITALYAQTITIPSSPLEQQKIADCLSSVDELITAQSLKIEALKSHKKGLMQQLFPSMDKVDG